MSRVLPILFNTDMVRAILDGRKTVTRRVMKPANPFRNKERYHQGNGLWIDGYSKNDEPNGYIKDYSVSSCWLTKKYYIEKYAPYQPGDILYVRETFQKFPNYKMGEYPTQENPDKEPDSWDYVYKADNLNLDEKWTPSIHMPKEAARIWLKVTDVRVGQLQDMTLDDFLSEGVVIRPEAFNDPENAYMQARSEFVRIWDSTIKKEKIYLYGWDGNPWVWVTEFERCEKP